MYINTQTLKRTSEREIRSTFPNTSFPVPFVPPEGYAVLFQYPQPIYDAITEFVQEVTPVKINDKWYQTWEVVTLDADTILANQATGSVVLQQTIVDATQKHLDTFAKTRNYDSILSACTYATSAIPKFQSEGQYCVNSRDATWSKLYSILAEVQAGTRPMPQNYSEIEPELPQLTWP